MFGDINQADQIYIACGYTDMRKSIDGLVWYRQDSFANSFAVRQYLKSVSTKIRLKAGIF